MAFKMKHRGSTPYPMKKSPVKDTQYFTAADMGPDGNMNKVVNHNEKHDRNPEWGENHDGKITNEGDKKKDAKKAMKKGGEVLKMKSPNKHSIRVGVGATREAWDKSVAHDKRHGSGPTGWEHKGTSEPYKWERGK